jgi:hypothetical protein
MKTEEPCPTCGMQATCEHGRIVNERKAHVWTCRECGEDVWFLGYACVNCEQAEHSQMPNEKSQIV